MQWWGSSSIANTNIINFAPNPARRHTRGRRGHANVAWADAEEQEYQLTKLANDRAARRESGTIRERERQEHSDAKKFTLRGFKGKGFTKLQGQERLDAMAKAARAQRVATGREGLSAQLRRFATGEGLVTPSRRPTQPWRSQKAKRGAKQAPTHTTPQPLTARGLYSAVAKYKRDGSLPHFDVGEVQAVKAEGIDARALKRMIQAMLIRAGVEPNPGPDGEGDSCIYSGMTIRGERLRIKGKLVLLCTSPTCHARLTNISGSSGLHPGERVETSPMPIPSAPPLPEGFDTPTPASNPPTPSPGSTPSPASSTPGPTVPPPPPAAPVAKKEEPAKPPEKAPVTLKGHTLTTEDKVAILERLTGGEVLPEDIVEQTMTVAYDGERRLATNRNVMEIKQGFTACQLSTVESEEPFFWAPMVLFSSIVAAGFYPLYRNLHHAYTNRNCVFANTRLDYYLCIRIEPPWWHLPIMAAVVFALAGTAWYLLCYRHRKGGKVAYIPHLVSAVLAEYDRGTNAVAARSTLRQKMRRLACLPIPDEDALVFITGSELVCEQLLQSENFFAEGAACFRQPL
jgi:hypothetical protein